MFTLPEQEGCTYSKDSGKFVYVQEKNADVVIRRLIRISEIMPSYEERTTSFKQWTNRTDGA